MRVLVMGGTEFISLHLVRALLGDFSLEGRVLHAVA
jgi:uncharacterized protein YbjT (DUF2867 family)